VMKFEWKLLEIEHWTGLFLVCTMIGEQMLKKAAEVSCSAA
jgi:hypothetical protein